MKLIRYLPSCFVACFTAALMSGCSTKNLPFSEQTVFSQTNSQMFNELTRQFRHLEQLPEKIWAKENVYNKTPSILMRSNSGKKKLSRHQFFLVMAGVPAYFAILAAIGFTANIFTSRRKTNSTLPSVAVTCRKKIYNSPNRLSTLDYSKFNYFIPNFGDSFEEQKCPHWCWAACVKMVLQHDGLSVTQEDVVKRVFGATDPGEAPCRPGKTEIALETLSGWIVDNRGTPSEIKYSDRINRLSDDEISGYLSNHQPIIVNLRNMNKISKIGDAVVMIGADYNDGQLSKVLIADPYPGRDAIRAIPIAEFKERADKFMKVYVTKNMS